MRVLISSPSLSVKDNVSGISALVAPLVEFYPGLFSHLLVGTPDGKKSVFYKVLYLARAVIGVIKFSCYFGEKVFHLNTAANTPSLVRDFLLLILARLCFLPVIVHFHGGAWITNTVCPRYARFLVWALASFGKACIVLGQDEADVLKNRIGVDRSICILPNYVNPYYACNPSLLNKDVFTILFLGRLVESKSVGSLAELFSVVLNKVPDSRLIVCGDGPLRQELLDKLMEIPARSWSYEGVVFGEHKLELLKKSDVFILPSISGEGMPVAMLEAMACGVIPVVTRLGAIPNVIDQGVDGFIAKPGDTIEFAELVVEALTSGRRETIRLNSLNKSRLFSLAEYKTKLDAIYDI